MSRQFLHRYAVAANLLADTPDLALSQLLDAPAVNLGSRQRFHGAITETGDAVYLFNANRAKGRRLAVRLYAALGLHGHLSYLTVRPAADGLYPFVSSGA